jgi:hypothetical protein
MVEYIDLWSYSNVRAHQNAILSRLRDGTMPCDAALSGTESHCCLVVPSCPAVRRPACAEPASRCSVLAQPGRAPAR